MRKVWGWILFLIAIGIVRLFIHNLNTYDNVNWWIASGWILLGALCLFGWYRFALKRYNKTSVNQKQAN